jgi:hypothetical protein
MSLGPALSDELCCREPGRLPWWQRVSLSLKLSRLFTFFLFPLISFRSYSSPQVDSFVFHPLPPSLRLRGNASHFKTFSHVSSLLWAYAWERLFAFSIPFLPMYVCTYVRMYVCMYICIHSSSTSFLKYTVVKYEKKYSKFYLCSVYTRNLSILIWNFLVEKHSVEQKSCLRI